MRTLLATLLLPTALLPMWGQEAVSPPSITPEELQEQLKALHTEAKKMEATAAEGSLAEAAFDPTSPMPEPPPGQSAAVADGGLIFDNDSSRLTYVGNVRLNDPHLQLRAAHSLYIHLPKNEQKEADKPAPEQPKPATAGGEGKAKATPAAKEAEPAPQTPAFLTVEHASVDVLGSRVLLIGRHATPSITLTRGSDSMVLQTAGSQSPAFVFSNAAGDVLIEGRQMVFVWHNEKGEEWKLEVGAGPVVYAGKERQLRVRGAARLTTATGSLECDESLTIHFAAAPATAAKAPDSPFAAFTTVQFKEVEHATAKGHVALTTPATNTRPAGIAKGDSLDYDATTGTCILSGICSLVYGGNSLAADGKVQLLPNGDVSISSSVPISGTYERQTPGEPEGATISGTWSTPGNILYTAQANCFIFPRGLTAQDSVASFSCTGELQVFTAPRPDAKPAARKPGMPNLAIAQQEEVLRVLAEGEVRLHSEATASAPVCDLSGDALDAHLPTAEVLLKARHGRHAHARYGDYELDSRSADPSEASIHLLPNGDLQAAGEQLQAYLPGEKGPIHMVCSRALHLQREAALLTLGENSRIDSPDGILTARASLQAELERASTPSRAPKKYPQLDYNFSGLRRANTPHGGSLRTTQASMQCEGAMAVELVPGATTSGDPRKNLRAAMARDRVSVAGKDSTGRLLRANGERLDFDPASGNFYLRGSTVTLADRYNTHSASGAGACVTIDPHNNVHISGRKQVTTAHRVHEQLEKNKKK